MSNWKHAYGWVGHILVSNDDADSDPDDNVIAIPKRTFAKLEQDYDDDVLDERIVAHRLGIIDSDYVFLAFGHGFSEGFKHFGTVFMEAELKAEKQPLTEDRDAAYLSAMKDIYGLDLPPCRIMVGCASEH